MRKLVFVCVISVALCGVALAQDLRFTGTIESSLGVEFDSADFCEALTKFTGELDFYSGNNSAYANADVGLDVLKIKNGETGQFGVNGLLFNLNELWYEYSPSIGETGLTFDLKIGRQIQAWGKADEVAIVDVLCPQNLTSLNLGDYASSRLGVDAMKLGLSGEIFGVDFYWLPIFRSSKLPLDKNNRLYPVLVKDVTDFGKENGIDVSDFDLKQSNPKFSLANANYAARASFWLPSVDFSFYGYYGFCDEPVYAVSKMLADVDFDDVIADGKLSGNLPLEFKKYGMVGADVAVPVSNFVLRGEVALYIDKAFAYKMPNTLEDFGTWEDDYSRKQQLSGLFGIDWTPSFLTFSAQYYVRHIFDYENKIDAYKTEHGATLSLSKTFFAETLELAFSAVVNFNDFDSGYFAQIKYKPTDNLMLFLSAQFFAEGPREVGETYGKYKNLSAAYVGAKFTF